MLVGCPKCKTKYKVSANTTAADAGALRCGKCGCLFRLTDKPAVSPPVREPAAHPGRRIKVLVANESSAFCRTVEKVLAAELFDVVACHDGKAALDAVGRMSPDVLLVDVALPVMFGFEVCEAVRNNPATAGIKIILLSVIYDKTRYRREPQSLYGADDYIEKHQIPELLADKICRLVFGSEKGEVAAEEKNGKDEPGRLVKPELSDGEKAELEGTRQKPGLPVRGGDAGLHERARRLARLIVSEIALYNPELVEEGVRDNSFYQLLAADIQEGRALYERRIPVEIRLDTKYLEQAFEDLISRKRREMNMATESGVRGG